MHECHITIDPVFGEERALVEKLAAAYGFKLANLVMVKGGVDTASQRDTFMTGHHEHYDVLHNRMHYLVRALREAGFGVRRAKIEHIIFDTKYGDAMP